MADRSDKTEKATPKRRKKARSEGSVAKSPDLTSWLTLLVIVMAAGPLLHFTGGQLAHVATEAETVLSDPTEGRALSVLGSGLWVVVEVGCMVGAIATATGVVGTIAQIGFFASGKTLKPKFKKLSPIAGVKRLLSPHGAWELAKSLVKLAIIGFVAYAGVQKMLDQAGVGTSTSLGAEISLAGGTVLHVFRTVAILGLLFSLADYAVQKHKLSKNIKMSKQEIKDEAKDADGDPHTKGKIKQRMRQMSRNRMMAAVSRADVVVMNPTHFAVAIRYQTSENPAPIVIAKGTDAVALRIRAEAHKHHIPVVEDPPLARALHALCKLDQQIPANLFVAVARLLAFVYKLPVTGRLYATSHRTPEGTLPLSLLPQSAEGRRELVPQSATASHAQDRGGFA
ncbi:flagellar biosynthesis protein FlhB [Acidothermaceae bacterium B102]|nr:flagellar biosynthesis protein FlhB [Acidothermaceae bacterium B102]